MLEPFGRSQLGKRDFYLNRRIRLRPLRQNISYFAIDVDQLPVRRPDLARQLLTEVSTALFNDEIRPLAHRIFSLGEIEDAFRLMQSSGQSASSSSYPTPMLEFGCVSRRRSPCGTMGPT